MKLAAIFTLVLLRSYLVMGLFTVLALSVLSVMSLRLAVVESVEARFGSSNSLRIGNG